MAIVYDYGELDEPRLVGRPRDEALDPESEPDREKCIWAAGVISCRGTFCLTEGKARLVVQATRATRESAYSRDFLVRLVKWFGGSIREKRDVAFWTLQGKRVLEFVDKIAAFLPPNRRNEIQMRLGLETNEKKEYGD